MPTFGLFPGYRLDHLFGHIASDELFQQRLAVKAGCRQQMQHSASLHQVGSLRSEIGLAQSSVPCGSSKGERRDMNPCTDAGDELKNGPLPAHAPAIQQPRRIGAIRAATRYGQGIDFPFCVRLNGSRQKEPEFVIFRSISNLAEARRRSRSLLGLGVGDARNINAAANSDREQNTYCQ
jgi:hypothetical protein